MEQHLGDFLVQNCGDSTGTPRPPHGHFLSRDELGADRDEDVTIAQLHYTTVVHLGRVHDLLHRPARRALRYVTTIAPPEPGFGSATLAAQAASATAPERAAQRNVTG